MSDGYRKLTSSCVSFTIYQQCHGDIEGNVTPLQYQNVHWEKNLLSSEAAVRSYYLDRTILNCKLHPQNGQASDKNLAARFLGLIC